MLGCVVVVIGIGVGSVLVGECGLLLSGGEYEVGVHVDSEVCVCVWS